MSVPEVQRHSEMIVKECTARGLIPDSWGYEDGRVKARLGRWTVLDDIEGLAADETGQLRAVVIGEHGDERVAFFLTPDGQVGGMQVTPFQDVDPL